MRILNLSALFPTELQFAIRYGELAMGLDQNKRRSVLIEDRPVYTTANAPWVGTRLVPRRAPERCNRKINSSEGRLRIMWTHAAPTGRKSFWMLTARVPNQTT